MEQDYIPGTYFMRSPSQNLIPDDGYSLLEELSESFPKHPQVNNCSRISIKPYTNSF